MLSRQLILSLYLPATVLSLGESMVAPVIPNLARTYGLNVAEASLVFVALSLGSFAVTVPAGYLMDRVGRRPVLLSGPILEGVGSLMTPFAHSFPELLLWRFLVGAAGQLWQQGRLLIIAESAPRNQRARQLQWMMGMTRTGQLLGPSVGGLLADGFAIWVPFVVHAILTLAIVLPSFTLVRETAPRHGQALGDSSGSASAQGWRTVFRYVLTFQLLVFLGVQFITQLARGGQDQGSLNLYAVYAYGMRPSQLGLLNTVAVFLSVPVPFLTGYLMDRFGRRAVIPPGFALYGLALVFMSLTAFFPLPLTFFLAAYVLVQAAAGTTGGTMQVLGTDLLPAVSRGRFLAIWRMVSQLAAAAAPAAYAQLAEHAGYGPAFLYLAACALTVVVAVSLVLGDTQRELDHTDGDLARRR